MSYWYLAINNKSEGPFTVDKVGVRIRSGQVSPQTLAFTQGMADWTPLNQVPQFHTMFRMEALSMPPVPSRPTGRLRSHEIDYEVFGDDMQFVEITLDPQEAVIAEAGGMMYMSQGIQMATQFGDGSQPSAGFFDKVISAGKRVLTGESLFMTVFSCSSTKREKVAFAAPYPGKIVPIDLTQIGGTLICQKDAFLCAAKGTAIGISFSRKIGRGLFGGEGFILQKLEGDGMAFMHAGGTITSLELAPGETLRVDTGCLVAFQPSVNYDIQFTGGVKNTLFGGEGLFLATLTGPGKVFLQSLPFSRLADRIYSAAPRAGGGRREEGSLLGGLGGLLDGDNS
ncbi:MAG: TIGR00266 family protein [Acidimicrobiia bacterium]|nr:TIGR00266 family protein [Acidimicrobiia bacterium]